MKSKKTLAQKRTEKVNKITIGVCLFGAVLAVVTGIYFLAFSGSYTPHSDTYVFERDVALDQGSRLDPKRVTALGDAQTSLSDLCSKESQGRWGADGQGDDGVGLSVTFVKRSGTRIISKDAVTIPSWQRFDETPEPARRTLVKNSCKELTALRTAFTSAERRDCVSALVVDTTGGMNANLVRRAHETITDSRASLTGDTCATGGFYFYRLTANPSEGDRRRVLRDAGFDQGLKEAEAWLLASQREQAESSVLRSFTASLTELSRVPSDATRVDIFTDALENVGQRSIYRDPTLLDLSNWQKLDAAWTPTTLKLAGMTVHLHPLPGESERDTALTQKAFSYVQARLEAAGAVVVIDSL